jgi:hypothetical protein
VRSHLRGHGTRGRGDTSGATARGRGSAAVRVVVSGWGSSCRGRQQGFLAMMKPCGIFAAALVDSGARTRRAVRSK